MPPAGAEPAKSSRAVPATHPFGPQAHSSKQPDAIHRRFQASMRNRDERGMDQMRQGIPRGYTARRPPATARTAPAVSTLD